MGYPMALNLIKSGNKIYANDIDKTAMQKIQKEGGEQLDPTNPLEYSFKNSDAIVTMLPNFTAVKKIWEEGFKHAKKGTYFIDCSTISPIDAESISKQAHESGFIPADAPVSGGVMGAQKATLSFMVGSESSKFENVKSILLPMGKNFFYCGKSSFGQVAKMCNNLCLGITMTGLSESLALGVKMGIDPKILSEVMCVSSSRCWSLDTYNPIPDVLPTAPSSRNYENGLIFNGANN
jgi:3-hydroxyisobutyrate dehydrogenase